MTAQRQKLGDINASGIKGTGEAIAKGISDFSNNYWSAKDAQKSQDLAEQAASQKQAMAEEELSKVHRENAYESGAPSEEAASTNYGAEKQLAQKMKLAEIAKLQREAQGSEAKPEKVETVDPQTGKKVTMFVTPKAGQSYQAPATEEKPQLITTVDPKTGASVQKFVTPQAGEQYAAKPPEPQKVTSATAAQIGAYDAATDMAEQLEKKYNDLASGHFSGLKSLVASTDANKYNKDRDYAAQTIGSNLEGGKLSDKDYDRYRNMLPAPGDTNEIAAEKMITLKNYIIAKKRGEIGGLSNAGFDMTQYGNIPPSASTSIGSKQTGTAIAAPIRKKPEEMTDAELDAELSRLKTK